MPSPRIHDLRLSCWGCLSAQVMILQGQQSAGGGMHGSIMYCYRRTRQEDAMTREKLVLRNGLMHVLVEESTTGDGCK